MKKKILIFTIIISIITLYTYSYADNLEEQKHSVETEIQETKDAIEDISKEKEGLVKEVNELNESIAQVESELSDLEDKIKNLDESISFKQKDLKEKEILLDERLSAVYMSSGNTYLEAFFSGGIINFVSNYDIIKQIAEYDNNLIEEVKKEKADLENSKIELENSKVQVQVKQKELNGKKSERIAKVQSLTEEQKAMQATIEDKQDELSRINQAVKKAAEEAEEAARRAALDKAQKNNGSNNNGNGEIQNDPNPPTVSSGGMTWPTRIAHRVNSVYAPNGRVDTVGHIGSPHKGLDIYAPEGTPIYAAKEGTVVYVNYSGYGGGWGLYVVIYHGTDSNGKAMYTRYAHGSAIASGIKVGSKVTTGSVIMYAGNTGASEGAHLHFEVCLGNMYSQVNPCTYLGITNTRGQH